MSTPTIDVEKLRRNLWYIVPMFSAMAALCLWMTWDLVTLMQHIAARAPMVRFWPGAVIGPVGLVFFGAALILALVRATAYEGPFTRMLDKVLLYSGLVQVGLIGLIFFASSIAQNHVMPARGYTQCSLLQGNPSLWFTDWIQNPNWCVSGKDMAWVLEQARTTPRP